MALVKVLKKYHLEAHSFIKFVKSEPKIFLSRQTPSLYKRAQAFTLAAGYGTQRVMSSYFFQDTEAGPPADSNEHILDVLPHADGTCGNGWVCEHR